MNIIISGVGDQGQGSGAGVGSEAEDQWQG